jgi:hypothetical protein
LANLQTLPPPSRGRPREGKSSRLRILTEAKRNLASRNLSCEVRQIEESWKLVDEARRLGSGRFDFDALTTL